MCESVYIFRCFNFLYTIFILILKIFVGISINFELAPFKLTKEMIMLLTINSQRKQYFIFTYIHLVVKGYILNNKMCLYSLCFLSIFLICYV